MDRVPGDFNLGRAVIVSFEGDLVRFFDPDTWSGGFYAGGELK